MHQPYQQLLRTFLCSRNHLSRNRIGFYTFRCAHWMWRRHTQLPETRYPLSQRGIGGFPVLQLIINREQNPSNPPGPLYKGGMCSPFRGSSATSANKRRDAQNAKARRAGLLPTTSVQELSSFTTVVGQRISRHCMLKRYRTDSEGSAFLRCKSVARSFTLTPARPPAMITVRGQAGGHGPSPTCGRGMSRSDRVRVHGDRFMP